MAQTSGPALAGALVSLLTAPRAVLVDAVTYLGSGLLLMRVQVDEPPPRPRSTAGVAGEAAEGLRWIYRHPTLRPLAMSTHGWFLSSAAANAILPVYALRTLDLSPFGLALAVGGVGGLLGALMAVRLGTRPGPGRVVIGARATTAAPTEALLLAANPPVGATRTRSDMNTIVFDDRPRSTDPGNRPRTPLRAAYADVRACPAARTGPERTPVDDRGHHRAAPREGEADKN